MRIIKIQRTIRKRNDSARLPIHKSVRQFGRDFFKGENQLEFVIEALVFGVLVVISAWPIAAAAEAIKQLL